MVYKAHAATVPYNLCYVKNCESECFLKLTDRFWKKLYTFNYPNFPTMNQWLINIFQRDLLKLKEELSLYQNEADMWKLTDGISNSAGNLALHLIGNLNHFIGATLGNTGYVRNRDAEFALKDVPREKILADIDTLLPIVSAAILPLSTAELEQDFPLEVGGRRAPTGQFLIHLTAHLSYHLGQINYHRRLLTA